MEVIAKNIDREMLEAYADGELWEIAPTDKYRIEFVLILNGSTFESNLQIRCDHDVSFTEAERIIKEKFSKVEVE